MGDAERATLTAAGVWIPAVRGAPGSMLRRLIALVVAGTLSIVFGVVVNVGPVQAASGNLVMVTPDGAFGSGDDAAKRTLFESFGWTVTAIDDGASAAAFTTAAASNDVMFVSDSITDTAHETKVRDAAIGVVAEKYGPKGLYLFGSPNEGFVSETSIRITDISHYITSPFATGTLAIYSTAADVNYWQSGTTALPSGVTSIADRPTNSNHETLYVAEAGATLYSSNTAPDRRVFVPSDSAGIANWTADYETIIERSLDWAGGFDTSSCAPGDSDSDGLQDCEEDANTDADDDPSTNPGPDTDGDTTPNYLDADDDGDGTPTASENADPNGDGDPRDALDTDRDGEPDYLDVPTGAADTVIAAEQKISDTAGGFTASLGAGDGIGLSVSPIGDLDGDGVVDVVASAAFDDDGGTNRGAVYVLFLNADGTVKTHQKISASTGGFTGPLGNEDQFGWGVTGLGDLDGDGINDIAVSTPEDDDGGTDAGAVYVLFLNADGTVKAEQKITEAQGGFATNLAPSDNFGVQVASLGDVDGDGLNDLVVGAAGDASYEGAVYVLFLNADGTVKAEQRISDGVGGMTTSFVAFDVFGYDVAGPGDIDGDGIPDLAVGVPSEDDGGSGRGAVMVLFLNADGTVKAEQKISDTTGGLSASLGNDDNFGTGVGAAGDIDGDGTPDLLAGAPWNDAGQTNGGAAYILLLNPDGTVKSTRTIDSTSADFTGPIDGQDEFGYSVAGLGDLDGDGAINFIVGATADDDGVGAGALYVFDLTAFVDSDGDGLWDSEEDANTDADDDPATNPGPDTDGDTTPNYLDADDDGDGTPTSAENADPNADGDPRDALDSDGDGQPDWLDPDVAVPSRTPVVDEQKVGNGIGGLTEALQGNDWFGVTVAPIGDLDGDGIADVAVGANGDDDGGTDRGAVYILFLNADGTVKAEQKISSTQGGLTGPLDNSDQFGFAVAGIGDIDGDGIGDLATTAKQDDDGGTNRGAVYILFLNADGTVRAEQKISDTEGGLAASLSGGFAISVTNLGDLDDDGINDLAVGAAFDDTGGTDRGAVYILFLNADGTVKAESKIANATGGGPTLTDGDQFGTGVASLGDLDGNGAVEVAVGAWADSATGAVWILSLDTAGTSTGNVRLAEGVGGFTGDLDVGDDFGVDVASPGDLDGDGINDLVVGSPDDDDGGTDRGALYLLALNSDGTVKTTSKISDTTGGLTQSLDDGGELGYSVNSLGDLDGDGGMNLIAGGWAIDDGSTDTGAIYIVDLCAQVDSDGDGLLDCFETPYGDTDGDTTPNDLDADDDGDTVPTASESADPNADGDPRDALDTDRDGQPDYLDVEAGPSRPPVRAEQKISNAAGGKAAIDGGDAFGSAVASIGDVDGDGINDAVVGAINDDDGGVNDGAVYILFLNADGSVKAEQKISQAVGGLTGPTDAGDQFGNAVAGIGDINGDGTPDIAVGARYDDDGNTNRGAVYILFLDTDGTVKAEQKISDTVGGFVSTLGDSDYFGWSVAGLGDVDGDGTNDIAVGANRDDDGGTDAGAAYILFLDTDGTVKAEQKISDTTGGFLTTLDNSDYFGESVAGPGDIDADGTPDLVVGTANDDDGANNAGAAYVLFLNTDGTVKAEQKLSATAGGLDAALAADDDFGSAAAGVGDLDGDGTPDIAIGAPYHDAGGTSQGAIYLIALNADGTAKTTRTINPVDGNLTGPIDNNDFFGSSIASLGDLDADNGLDLAIGVPGDDDILTSSGAVFVLDLADVNDTDGDGLWDFTEDDNTDADNDATTTPGPDTDSDTTPNYLDTDDDGDGTPTISENADPNGDGEPRDAIDTDRDGQPDYLDTEAGPSTTPVVDEQKIANGTGGLTSTVPANYVFGTAATSVGDLDGDGIVDLVVGAPSGGGGRFYTLLMNADGTVKSEVQISSTSAGLDSGDWFGGAVAGIGDINGDGIGDLAVGARYDDDGNPSANRGAVYILFLDTDGTVKGEQKISNTVGGFVSALGDNDFFGWSVAGLGDVDGDGTNDIAVGANRDDDGGTDRGAVYILFLDSDGTVKADQKISDLTGGFLTTLDNSDYFGGSVAGPGDIDADGTPDIVVGAYLDDDGATNTGAAYVLFLNSNGTVKAEQKLSPTTGGLGLTLANSDYFGMSAAAVGDLDGDGTPDIAVGAPYRDDGGSDQGSIYLVSLNADGTAKNVQTISSTEGGFTGPLDPVDYFGMAIASLGDLDGDGTFNLAVGAPNDDSGNANTGAIYVLDLTPDPCTNDDTDGDGLHDCYESQFGDTDGDTTPNELDADDDGDGIPTASENADPNADGDPRDALDADRDGQPDWLDAPLTAGSLGIVDSEVEIASTTGGFSVTLDDSDYFGAAVTSIGDLDGDGIPELVASATGDDDTNGLSGAAYVLFLNADGTVRAEQKISNLEGGLTMAWAVGDGYGDSVAGVGDIDGDGVPDLAVGAYDDDDGGTSRGGVVILFMNADGTVKAEQLISNSSGGGPGLDDYDYFGAVTNVGDLDDDGINDIAVGAYGDDDVAGVGAVYILFLNADGTAKATQKISPTVGGFGGALDSGDGFGRDVAGLGDVDGDGNPDLAVGVRYDDDGGSNRGAVWILFLNADGTVKAEQKISSITGGLATDLDNSDYFGESVAGVGDLDLDGTPDLVVGATADDDGGSSRGAIHILFLNPDGTVGRNTKISDTAGGLTTALANTDYFGSSVTGLGDIDGDGTADLAVGAEFRDTGGSSRGSVFVLLTGTDLPSTTVVVNSTADGSDASPGDGTCETATPGECTLRAAIEEANASSAVDVIEFAIPQSDPGYTAGPDAFTFTPTSVYPNITERVTIDGTTQTEYVDQPVIVIDGSGTGTSSVVGLHLDAGSDASVIRALNINSYDDFGMRISSSGHHTITGMVIGLERDGTTAAGNRYGIYADTAAYVTIGGTGANEGNVIAAGDWGLSWYNDSNHATFVGNYIGTDVTGLLDRGHTNTGIFIVNSSSYAQVGGPTAAHANVIAGNNGDGIYIGSGTMVAPVVEGNLVGVGADGITPIANGGDGIELGWGTDGTIIDNTVGAAGESGIEIGNHDNAVVRGNSVGTDSTGTASWTIGGDGVLIAAGADNGTIGGTTAADENMIKGVTGDGIHIAGGTTTVLGNAIWGSGGLGIDIADGSEDPFGVTANDATDADTGINGLLNYPTLAPPIVASTTLAIDLDAPAGDYRIEIFENPADGADASGHGEGENRIHAQTITHTGSGLESFTLTGLPAAGTGDVLTATATEDLGAGSYGATSEFSAAATEGVVIVNSTGDGADASAGDGKCSTGGTNSEGDPECTLRAAIEETNASVGLDTITFAIPATEPNHRYHRDDLVADSLGITASTTLDDAAISDFDPDYPAAGWSWWSIEPATDLPAVSGATLIDGTTQPGWQANTVIDGSAITAQLPIRIVGPTSGATLQLSGSGTTLRGLNIASGNSSGVMVWFAGTGGHTVEGSWLMMGPVGVTSSSGDFGSYDSAGSDNNTIGGPDAADLVLVGDGFGGTGLILDANDYTLQNVWFGVSARGNEVLGGYNDIQLDVGGDDNVIGTPGAGVIVATSLNGQLYLSGNRNIVQGSRFGVLADGTLAPDNRRDHVNITGTDNMFGGVGAGEGNIVVDGTNSWAAVVIGGGSGHSILGNLIRHLGSNHLYIDISPTGVNANDVGDVDSGVNDLLNHPVISGITDLGATLDVDFDLDVPAGDYRIELFGQDPSGAPPAGYGAGDSLVGVLSVTHTGSGVETFTLNITDPGDAYLSATVTEDLGGGDYGSTSEFGRTICVGDADGDGLCDDEEDANTDADGDPTTNPGPDTDGDTTPNYLDSDDDGDGTPTASENADPNGDGDPATPSTPTSTASPTGSTPTRPGGLRHRSPTSRRSARPPVGWSARSATATNSAKGRPRSATSTATASATSPSAPRSTAMAVPTAVPSTSCSSTPMAPSKPNRRSARPPVGSPDPSSISTTSASTWPASATSTATACPTSPSASTTAPTPAPACTSCS